MLIYLNNYHLYIQLYCFWYYFVSFTAFSLFHAKHIWKLVFLLSFFKYSNLIRKQFAYYENDVGIIILHTLFISAIWIFLLFLPKTCLHIQDVYDANYWIHRTFVLVRRLVCKAARRRSVLCARKVLTFGIFADIFRVFCYIFVTFL